MTGDRGASAEKWRTIQDSAARRRLGCSWAEFVDRWESGVYHWGHDLDNHCDIAAVAMLFPDVCS